MDEDEELELDYSDAIFNGGAALILGRYGTDGIRIMSSINREVSVTGPGHLESYHDAKAFLSAALLAVEMADPAGLRELLATAPWLDEASP